VIFFICISSRYYNTYVVLEQILSQYKQPHRNLTSVCLVHSTSPYTTALFDFCILLLPELTSISQYVLFLLHGYTSATVIHSETCRQINFRLLASFKHLTVPIWPCCFRSRSDTGISWRDEKGKVWNLPWQEVQISCHLILPSPVLLQKCFINILLLLIRVSRKLL
jgi:hypothetical protein